MTSTTVGELVERLRSAARGADAWRVMDEAADKLSSLQKEIDTLRGAAQFAVDELAPYPRSLAQWAGGLSKTISAIRKRLNAALSNTVGHNG